MQREIDFSTDPQAPSPNLSLRDLVLMYLVWFFLAIFFEMTRQLIFPASIFLTQGIHYLFFITLRLLFIPAALYFIVYRGFLSPERVGLKLRHFWRMSKIGLKIAVPIIPLTLLLVHLPLIYTNTRPSLRPMIEATSPQTIAVSLVYSFLLFFMTVIPAFSEELLFRGLTFSFFQERIGTWKALILSGIVYGLFYMPINIHLGVLRIILGFFASYLFWRSKSLIPSTYLQAAFHTAFSLYVFGWSWW